MLCWCYQFWGHDHDDEKGRDYGRDRDGYGYDRDDHGRDDCDRGRYGYDRALLTLYKDRSLVINPTLKNLIGDDKVRLLIW